MDDNNIYGLYAMNKLTYDEIIDMLTLCDSLTINFKCLQTDIVLSQYKRNTLYFFDKFVHEYIDDQQKLDQYNKFVTYFRKLNSGLIKIKTSGSFYNNFTHTLLCYASKIDSFYMDNTKNKSKYYLSKNIVFEIFNHHKKMVESFDSVFIGHNIKFTEKDFYTIIVDNINTIYYIGAKINQLILLLNNLMLNNVNNRLVSSNIKLGLESDYQTILNNRTNINNII